MLNKVVLMGRLTRDPELRHTQSNIPVASFTLAVNRSFNRNSDSQQQTADFIDIVVWRQTAEFASKWFRKGQLVAVSGRLQIRKWTDRDNNPRTSAEVVADECYFAESKKGEGASPFQYGGDQEAAPASALASPGSDFEELIGDDEELPF